LDSYDHCAAGTDNPLPIALAAKSPDRAAALTRGPPMVDPDLELQSAHRKELGTVISTAGAEAAGGKSATDAPPLVYESHT